MGVFYLVGSLKGVKCWSIEIICANTKKVASLKSMFESVESVLERDVTNRKRDPGLIGLNRLNLECVNDLDLVFCGAIYKQETVDSLKGWRLNSSCINMPRMFCSIKDHLEFDVLNDWIVYPSRADLNLYVNPSVAVNDVFWCGVGNDKLPRWAEKIVKKIAWFQ